MTREFANEELMPNAGHWDKNHEFPAAAVAKMAELGLMGVAMPSKWGGSDLDYLAYAIAMEEVSRGCTSAGVIMTVNNTLYCYPVNQNATDEQKEEWLLPFASGSK